MWGFTVQLSGIASHQYRKGHGFESRWSPVNFISGSFFPVVFKNWWAHGNLLRKLHLSHIIKRKFPSLFHYFHMGSFHNTEPSICRIAFYIFWMNGLTHESLSASGRSIGTVCGRSLVWLTPETFVPRTWHQKNTSFTTFTPSVNGWTCCC